MGADSGRLERSFCFKSLLADISLPLCPCLGGFPTLHPKFLFCSFLSQLGTLSSPGYCNGNASLMPACLLSPLRDVAGDSVMAACVCDPSFLIFLGVCLSPSSSLWSPGFSKPALPLPGLHFLLLLHLHPLLFCCLSASLPSLMLLDSQPGPLAGSLLPRRERFPRNHFLAHLLPKFCYNCWAWPCIVLCSQNTTPPTYGICILQAGWTILVFLDFFFLSFSGLGLLGATALPKKHS